MTPMIVRRFAVGLRRHPVRWLVEAGLTYGALWTLVDSLNNFFNLQIAGSAKYGAMVVVSVLVGLLRALPALSVRRRIGSSTTYMTVCFGDLFATDGLRAVPVNEFFDSELGDHVSPLSLHGKLISQVLGGHPDAFDRQLSGQLATLAPTTISRARGKADCFPLGTHALIEAGGARYLVFALSHTDPVTLKASAGVSDLWEALEGLWAGARIHCNGAPVVVPLVGSGLSGVGLPPRQLLAALIVSAVDATRHESVCREIVIVLPDSMFEDVDLSMVTCLME